MNIPKKKRARYISRIELFDLAEVPKEDRNIYNGAPVLLRVYKKNKMWYCPLNVEIILKIIDQLKQFIPEGRILDYIT
jgi:hypothetical protein